jgi:predicted transcriptional regulator YheO
MYDKVKLTNEDKRILHALGTTVEGVAEAFGRNCEVVLHSLEDVSHSVIKIVNGHVTGRKVGSPLTDFGMEILEKADSLEKDVLDSYYSKLDDGRMLKCVTMLIRNTQSKPIGVMCINIDVSVPLLDFLRGFLPKRSESSKDEAEHFPSTPKELLNRILEKVMTDINIQTDVSASEKNKAIVRELYKRGMFNVRGAIDIVAQKMGVSRYTVYNYIREARVKVE